MGIPEDLGKFILLEVKEKGPSNAGHFSFLIVMGRC